MENFITKDAIFVTPESPWFNLWKNRWVERKREELTTNRQGNNLIVPWTGESRLGIYKMAHSKVIEQDFERTYFSKCIQIIWFTITFKDDQDNFENFQITISLRGGTLEQTCLVAIVIIHPLTYCFPWPCYQIRKVQYVNLSSFSGDPYFNYTVATDSANNVIEKSVSLASEQD